MRENFVFFNVFLTNDEKVGHADSISPPIYPDISGDISISILVLVKIDKKSKILALKYVILK